MTQQTERMELVSVDGPFRAVPRGRRYWVVRVMAYPTVRLNDCLSRPGDVASGGILRDCRFGSEREAREFAAGLPKYTG